MEAEAAHLCTAIPTSVHVFIRVQCVRLWNPPTVAPTRSCHGGRKHCNALCAAGPSPYQPVGSSQPTYSMGLTAGTTPSTMRSMYILNGTDCGKTTFNHAFDSTLAIAPPVMPPSPIIWTTRSGRRVRFLAHFNNWATISVRGGVMWEPTIMVANQHGLQQHQRLLGWTPLATVNKETYLQHASQSVGAALTLRQLIWSTHSNSMSPSSNTISWLC